MGNKGAWASGVKINLSGNLTGGNDWKRRVVLLRGSAQTHFSADFLPPVTKVAQDGRDTFIRGSHGLPGSAGGRGLFGLLLVLHCLQLKTAPTPHLWEAVFWSPHVGKAKGNTFLNSSYLLGGDGEAPSRVEHGQHGGQVQFLGTDGKYIPLFYSYSLVL